MKIYLDSCSLQRPLDDQSQVRIATETEAIMGILTLWEAGKIELIGSEALDYEADQIPIRERRAYMVEVLAKMNEFVVITAEMEHRAAAYIAVGIKPLDALHLICAVESKVDYFCTCDDKFLKKAKTLAGVKAIVASPLELVTKLPE